MFTSLWYSARLRGWAVQIALAGGLIAVLLWIAGNTAQNLTERGIRTGFDFLSRPARFPISESVIRYDPSDTFFWAYVVGVANTLWLSFLTILFATILGLAVGLARRSAHPLLSQIAMVFVTIMRNVPLIVQLLFWYGITTSIFPAPRDAFNPLPGVFLSLRGVYAPSLVAGPGAVGLIGVVLVAAMLIIWVSRKALRGGVRMRVAVPAGIICFGVVCVVFYGLFGSPIGLEMPELTGLNYRGGLHFTPEFAAIVFGITLYTSAFIGEIIRGGIEAVKQGQWEGGRALGLSERHIMFRIILPQALRVIIPPITSQYLSTVKNTTLAVAVGYPELGLVVNTVINQTGQALESILIMLGVYLSISLSVSVFMNWYNRRVALVER
ncbi:amino acid ABC transporter permease [Roseinatronobacter sp. S2]|uniref:amino acid ABC transporter permease n=1 Tax=Roseinatronobacter sp. S2 TaxID=3035471 RepID=UPI00240F3F47|nr:ABC transporter permease subunit [Roseinatronobacter sp. S2]WFE75771.1 ABC transporter permease subunit [Roseinatronobacter sp. S2]